MRQNNEEYELGTVEVIVNKVEKTLTKVIFSDYLGTIEYTLTYGEGGQIEKIGYTVEAEGETQEMIYNVKREGEQILIADEEEAETFTYVLKDGKIASYVDAYGTSFRLEYTDNYLTSVIGVYEGENEDGEIEKEEYPVEYKYTDNNLVAIDGGGLKFGEQKNITNGVDPVICIYKFILTAITENSDFFPHLLGLCGNSSANLPTSSDVIYGNLPFTYTYEEWGGIKSITCTDEEDVSTISFDEAKEKVAEKYHRQIRNPYDLEPEEEALIGQYFKEEYDADFVFVTHYPSKKRPFYAMDDPADPTYTLSFDLLYQGLEITTGGQRIHDYNMLLEKIEKRGMTTEGMEQYMDTFKHGMSPHGGLGIGLERLTMKLIGEDNVRETTLFPRDMSRLEP